MLQRLFFDNETMNFLQVTSNSKISMILINGGSNILSDHGNFIKRDRSDVGILSYLPKSVVKDMDTGSLTYDECFRDNSSRVKIRIGRFVRRFLSEQTFVDFSITNKDLEDFVNLYKSYFTPNKDNLQIVDGKDIMKWYLEKNYTVVLGNRPGSLWNSCMRQKERNIFMELYSINESVCKMLIFLSDDGTLRARALLWDNVLDKNGNVYKVMDRIYTVYDHDTFLFKSWAKENGYITKLEQNAKTEIFFDVNGQSMLLELKIKLSNYNLDYYPYLDTFKYFDLYGGYLCNSPNFIHQYKLVQSDGSLERELVEDDGYYDHDEENGDGDWDFDDDN